MGNNLTQAGDLQGISPRRQRERGIAERVFAEAVREIIAVHPDLEKEDLFPRLCGRFNLDDETWDRFQALGCKGGRAASTDMMRAALAEVGGVA